MIKGARLEQARIKSFFIVVFHFDSVVKNVNKKRCQTDGSASTTMVKTVKDQGKEIFLIAINTPR